MYGSSMAKNPPANVGVRILSLGQEDPMEEKMATCSSILAWTTPWTEEPGQLQSIGSHGLQLRVGHNLVN